MELLTALESSFDHVNAIVTRIRPEQFDARTPCDQWTVRELAGHALEVLTNMGRAARGEPAVWGASTPEPLAATFRERTAATLVAWRQRGVDGLVDVGPQPIPVTVAQTINLIDTTTHSWDIAVATGQDPEIPEDLAAMVLATAQAFVTDELRARVGFGPPIAVDSDASSTDRLVAFLGREPAQATRPDGCSPATT